MNANRYNSGLSSKEVEENKRRYGTNTIKNDTKNSFFKLLIESLGDPIIKILLIVLAVKTVFLFQSFDWFETLGIVIAITFASLISTISEYGSEKSFEKMQEETSRIKCKVRRDSTIKEIFIDEVVFGDFVELTSGDMIPADGVIVEGSITCDESSFTGESKDIIKNVQSEVFRGSVVLNGNAVIRVSAIGTKTKYGSIALELLDKNPESPLKLRLRELANIISRIGYTGAILVFLSYLFSVIFVANSFKLDLIWRILTTPKIFFGHIIYALTLAVTIIIVSVPEGLPMMIALVLSSNMKRMVKNNVLVRRMVGIETAGCINTLFSDKTGTITKGKMEVSGIMLGDGEIIRSSEELSHYPKIQKYILGNMKANNESKLDNKGEIIGGNITDKALLEFSATYTGKYSIIKHNFFDSVKKYSSVLIDDGVEHELVKGAPEKLISKTYEYYSKSGIRKRMDKTYLENAIHKYTNLGYRVLMLADKPSKYTDSLVFIALVFLKDEISESAKDAVNLITNAGVQIIMITGDAKDTAVNIGREIGLLTNSNDIVLTSSELSMMSDDVLVQKFPKIRIIEMVLMMPLLLNVPM